VPSVVTEAVAAEASLRRELNKWDLAAIGINQVIGSAIFLIPSDVARLVGPWGPVMFLLVGIGSLLIALCFAEVGSRFDRTGGPYLPARVAYGRFVGFEVGWMIWFTRVSSLASIVNGLALALAFYWPSLASGWQRQLIVSAVFTAIALINLRGIGFAKWFVNTLTIGKLTPLVLFIVIGIWFIEPARFTNMPPIDLQQSAAAALLLIFAYGGYEVTSIPAGEARNPQRDVPFAFVTTIIVVTIVMILTSIVATGLLPDVAATRTPIADGAALFMGAAGALVVSVGSVISMSGNTLGGLLAGSRALYALAENRELPRWFGYLHPTYRTPANSIVFSAAVGLALALTGSFVQMAAVSAVARLVTYLAVSTSTLVLRRRTPNAEMGPALFVTPLGPVVPVLASVVALAILFGATAQQLLMGTLALVGGAILFLIATRGAERLR
jgi:APA family basic amino acid/polyamine antiporter